jgi:microsomal dipeptidase-like Zn-dependent dipeptidase
MIRKVLGLLILLALGGVLYFTIFETKRIDARMNAVRAHAPYTISERAQTLHDDLYIADLHADTLLWRRNPEKRHDYGQVDLPRLREGGVDFQVFSSVTQSPRGQNFAGNASGTPDNITPLAVAQLWPTRTWMSIYERAAFQAQRLQKLEANPRNNLVIARRKADMDAPPGTLIGYLLTEGSHPLEGRVENVDRLFDEGYRAMGLQHFFDNRLGGSLHGATKGGLTEFGREAVTRMWDLNIAVDLAHSSEQVARDVLAMNRERSEPGAVFISHGGVRGGCPVTNQRNLPDDLLQELAAQGGILGVGYFHGAICDISPVGIATAIDKAIALMGLEAVALGSDFDGTVLTALDTSELAAITQALLDSGRSEPEIRAIMGETARQFFIDSLPD